MKKPPAKKSPGDDDSLGLPPEWNPKYIPDGGDLARAARRVLDDKTAFVLLHKDEPDVIADHLDELASIVLATSQVKGDHQAKAIRLGLTLEPIYWISRNKLHDWLDMFSPLLKVASEIHHDDLQSELFRAWGIYLYLANLGPDSTPPLDASLEYAADSGRADLALLAQLERLNAQVTTLSLTEVQAEAEAILVCAAQLNFTYVQGRTYLSLARAYQFKSLPTTAFTYAQQALAFFFSLGIRSMMIEALNIMIGSMQKLHGSSTYGQQLLYWMKTLSAQMSIPWYQITAYQHHAAHSFHEGNYETARAWLIKAWLKNRATFQLSNSEPEILHLLGMVQSRRQRYALAERHLLRAYRLYQARNMPQQAVHAHHAWAYVSFEKGDFVTAVQRLEKTLSLAQALPEEATRRRLTTLIEEDILEARRKGDEAG